MLIPAYDIGRAVLRLLIDDYDAGEEVDGGLSRRIKAHFGVEETGEILAKVVSILRVYRCGCTEGKKV